MKVTVCEFPDNRKEFDLIWNRLVSDFSKKSDIILLPELPFSKWFARTPEFDDKIWRQSVNDHEKMINSFNQCFISLVLGTCPVTVGSQHFNRGFYWTPNAGYNGVHDKYYLPEEEDFYERTWFTRNQKDFSLIKLNELKFGFLICTEVMFNDQSRCYGRQGANLIAVPRASSGHERWPIALRMAAIASGSFVISSNRTGDKIFGGTGYVINPEGEIIGSTTKQEPIITVNIDLKLSEQAKRSYPRDVPE